MICTCSEKSQNLFPSYFAFLKEGKGLFLALFLFLLGYCLPLPVFWKNIFFLLAYILSGFEVLVKSFSNLFHGKIFDENLLMTIATLGAFLIGEYPEGAAVMIFYQIGERLQENAADKSRQRIRRLMDIRPDTTRVLTSSGEQILPAAKVKVGQVIRVRPGERVGLDGELINGSGFLDLSALTGESRPVRAHLGNTILAGSISKDSTLEIRVQKTYENSALTKIIELTEHAAHKKSKAEAFITRFARIYTPIVVGIAVLIACLPPLLLADTSIKMWVYRALIFLVISCPCALVLSVPLGFFGGIGGAAHLGILVKGSTYLEQIAHISTLAFDKTGTLTQGVFDILNIRTIPSISQEELLSLAASMEHFSNHPIAAAIVKKYGNTPAPLAKQPIEIAGEGLYTSNCLVGNARLLERFNITPTFTSPHTCVHVAKDGIYWGIIELGDRLKPTTSAAIKQLHTLVPKLAIVSGDSRPSVEHVAQELNISLIYAELLPAAKVAVLEELIKNTPKKSVTAFAGDGINDAPVLTRADVGIAMGALGSDVAIEAADIVLMSGDVGKIATAIKIAQKTLYIVKQNVYLALGVKLMVLLLGIFGLANMWGAVFADVGVSLIAVFNSLRTLYFKE